MPSMVETIRYKYEKPRHKAIHSVCVAAKYHLDSGTPLPPTSSANQILTSSRFRAPLGGRILISQIPHTSLQVMQTIETLLMNNKYQLGLESVISCAGPLNENNQSVIVQLARPEPILALDPSSAEWGTLRRIELGVETAREVDQLGSADVQADVRRVLLHFVQDSLVPTFPFIFNGVLNKHLQEDEVHLASVAASLSKISQSFGANKRVTWTAEVQMIDAALQQSRRQDQRFALDQEPQQSFKSAFIRAALEVGLVKRARKVSKLLGSIDDELLEDDTGPAFAPEPVIALNETRTTSVCRSEAIDSLQEIRARAARSETPDIEINSNNGSILSDDGVAQVCEEDIEMLLDDE